MNQLVILVVALVVFIYFGGKYVPKVLKDNKQIMLGLVGGVALCSFMCKSVEGFRDTNEELVCNSIKNANDAAETALGKYTNSISRLLCENRDLLTNQEMSNNINKTLENQMRIVNGKYRLYTEDQIQGLRNQMRTLAEDLRDRHGDNYQLTDDATYREIQRLIYHEQCVGDQCGDNGPAEISGCNFCQDPNVQSAEFCQNTYEGSAYISRGGGPNACDRLLNPEIGGYTCADIPGYCDCDCPPTGSNIQGGK
tara:strand:+ start:2831 stop:3589 length:759 start_codon:yes stop_codon:yes gene_type:complete